MWTHEESLNLEADDLMGILATRDPENTIICSIDKDMKTIPCTLYNWDKDIEPKEVSREEALLSLAGQALTGDSTDGYRGLPGCGPVAVKKILGAMNGEDATEVWLAVWEAYRKKGLTTEDMIQQCRLARICQEGDWDFDSLNMTWKPGI
jgi:DNA polymerase-1